MELCRIDEGDMIDLPFWPGRVTLEALEYPGAFCSAPLVRLFWIAADGAEGVTTLSEYTQVRRISRFCEYATLPAYVPWGSVFAAVGHPAPAGEDDNGPGDDEALAGLRAALAKED